MTPARWPRLAAPRGRKRRDPSATSRSPAWRRRSSDWSRSWPRPASWWMCRQNCTRSWRRSPRARTPSRGRRRDRHRDRRTGPKVGVRAACEAVGAAQAGYYRRHRQSPATAAAGADPAPRPPPAPGAEPRPSGRRSSTSCTATGSSTSHRPRCGPRCSTKGVYLGSISTFYRLLRQAGQSRERRRQATHPATVKPELVATAPNQVWSWDITKLRGPAKWTYYYLYVILDIYSRYVVGWMVATRESAALAEVLIRQTCAKQGIGARPVDHPRRPRLLDDIQAGGVPARRSRRHPVPQPTPRLRRQPVQRGPVQDTEVPARLPRPVRLDRGRPPALPAPSSPGTTTNIATPGWACTPPPTSTTAPPSRSARNAPAVLDAAYAAHPERFVRKPPRTTASCQPPPGSTRPTTPRRQLSKFRSTVPHSG